MVAQAKVLGLITGGAVAAAAVTGFNAWRYESDADRLASALRDNCLPYVQSGITPFQDIGRSPGVYDQFDRNDAITNGGARLIFDNRFSTQWGESEDSDSPVRVCEISDLYARADSTGFEVMPQTLLSTLADFTGPDTGLVRVDSEQTPPPYLMIWTQTGADTSTGLRVILTAQMFGISGLLVVDDLTP